MHQSVERRLTVQTNLVLRPIVLALMCIVLSGCKNFLNANCKGKIVISAAPEMINTYKPDGPNRYTYSVGLGSFHRITTIDGVEIMNQKLQVDGPESPPPDALKGEYDRYTVDLSETGVRLTTAMNLMGLADIDYESVEFDYRRGTRKEFLGGETIELVRTPRGVSADSENLKTLLSATLAKDPNAITRKTFEQLDQGTVTDASIQVVKLSKTELQIRTTGSVTIDWTVPGDACKAHTK